MLNFFSRRRPGPVDSAQGQSAAAAAELQQVNRPNAGVTTGLAATPGTVRSGGGALPGLERYGEIPQERAVPGLPGPSGGIGALGRPRRSEPGGLGSEVELGRRNNQYVLPPARTFTRPEAEVSNSGMVMNTRQLEDDREWVQARPDSRLGSYQRNQRLAADRVPDKTTEPNLWEQDSSGNFTGRLLRGEDGREPRKPNPNSKNVTPQILEAGGQEMLQELTKPRPWDPEGAYVNPGKGEYGEQSFLSRASGTRNDAGEGRVDGGGTDLRAGLQGGDPSYLRDAGDPNGEIARRVPKLLQTEYPSPAIKKTGNPRIISPATEDTWTNSSEENLSTAIQMPVVGRNGQVVMGVVDSSKPYRVVVGDPDSTQSSETTITESEGRVLGELREQNRAQLMTKNALTAAKYEPIYGQKGENPQMRARVASPEERKGTLVGFLSSTAIDRNGRTPRAVITEEPIYKPKLENNLKREIPSGMLGSETIKEEAYRRGSPTGVDFNAIRNELLAAAQPGYRPTEEDQLKTPMFGMGFVQSRQPQRIFPANLEKQQAEGAQFFVETGTRGELRPIAGWRDLIPQGAEEVPRVMRGAVKRREGLEPTPIQVIARPGEEPRFFYDTNKSLQYTGPAVFSPNYSDRIKGEAMGGSMSDQMGSLINSGAKTQSNHDDTGMLGGAGGISEVLRRNQNVYSASQKRLQDYIRSGETKGLEADKFRPGVHPEFLERALLQSAGTQTGLLATIQGIRANQPVRNIKEFTEDYLDQAEPAALRRQVLAVADALPADIDEVTLSSIAAPGTYERQVLDSYLAERNGAIPLASAAPQAGVAFWQDGREQGINPRAAEQFNRWQRQAAADGYEVETNPVIQQALAEEADRRVQAADLNDSEEFYARKDAGNYSRESYEDQQNAFGVSSDAPDLKGGRAKLGEVLASSMGSELGHISRADAEAAALILRGADPGQIGATSRSVQVAKSAVLAADNLLGGSENPFANSEARRLAEVALFNTRGKVEGGTIDGFSLGRNIDSAASAGNLNSQFVDYALQYTGDGDFARAATIVDAARRSVTPRAPGQPIEPVDVLSAIEQLVGGGEIGSGLGQMSRGKQIAYQNTGAPYRQVGERAFDYDRYAQAMDAELGSSAQDYAMQFAADRIRRLQQLGQG